MVKQLFFIILFILVFSADLFAATYVNDGSINWNGNWQATANIDTLHATTVLIINTTARYTKVWNGVTGNTCRGVLIYITGNGTAETITVKLQEYTSAWADVSGASATLVVDSSTKTLTWYYFKWTTPYAETTGTGNYRVAISGSAAGTTTTARVDATATTNYGKIEVLSATGTLAASDVTYICGTTNGETGNPTAQTVTMNVNLNGTAYGSIDINNAGTLSYGNVAATTYYLEVAGNIDIRNGGTLTINGAIATSSTLEMNTTAADRYIYIRAGGILTATGKAFQGNVWRTTTTDSISVTTDRTVTLADNVQTAGWSANDQIIISTTGALAETEEKAISSVSGTTMTISTDWTATHLSGAEVCNLTRNVIITSTGTNDLDIDVYNTTANEVDFDWVQFKDIDNPTDIIISTAAENAAYSVDYCSFDDCFVSLGFGNDLTKELTFTNLCFWLNGNHSRAITFIAGALVSTQSLGVITLTNITIAKSSDTASTSAVSFTDAPMILENVNIYDGAGTSIRTGLYLDTQAELRNVKIWAIRGYGIGGVLGATGAVTFRTSLDGYNCTLGGDGTNTIANTSGDIGATTMTRYNFYNTKFLSGTEVAQPSSLFSNCNRMFTINSHNHDATSGRYNVWRLFGTISDQITGGQTAAWARGGSGTCVYMNPTSITTGNTLDWEFYVPVTSSGSPFSVHAYVKKSSAAANCTLTCTIYDSDDDNSVLLNAQSVTLTDTWSEYTSTSVSATDTGFCRVVFKALDGAVSGDIGIDDVHLATDIDVNYGNMDRWVNGLPALYFTDSTTSGGTSEYSYGYTK